tara:strand:- start:1463 stop:2380 length:918 start_codon:yes stop_codon:yes gene_type:complete
MVNDFFNDTLSPFVGIDIGWDQDPNFPIGDYGVVQDAADSTNRQFTLSQTEEDEVALSEGVLMITGPATSGFDQQSADDGEFSGRASWHQIGVEFAKLDGNDNPLLATGIDDDTPIKLKVGVDYGFWIVLNSADDHDEIANPRATVGRLVIEQIRDTIRFVGSSEHKDHSDAAKLVRDLGEDNQEVYPVIFLGSAKVELVEGETVATFTQFTFGPLTIPAISYLDGLISTDSKTLLMEGEDRGITTSPIAAEEGNDIINTDSGQVKLKIGLIPGGNIDIQREEENDGQPKIGVDPDAFAEDGHSH